ncbi:TrkH family potassium uptake protein [Sandaracinobacteroides sp. A072]|uniref:TrkH family potassium uptake protein n=1 Tax=Sandaracinobacteroides sp. A072 TaxID=3461146 RepID=UPI004042C2D5
MTPGLEARAIPRPERIIPLAFLIGIAAGTLLLMMPVSRTGSGNADFVTALFTATSALCVTGLTVVDTPTYWSPFGHVVILGLFQAGGFGIMTGATLIGLLVSKHMRLRSQLMASAEMRSLDLGDVRHVVRLVLVASLATEAVLAVALFLRFWMGLGFSIPDAAWHGLFHAVSAFNNAGFTTLPDGLMPHRSDLWLLTPLVIGVIAGGIGFPVLHELRTEWRQPRSWSIHTKLTLWGSLGLLVVGTLGLLLFEWSNPKTLGPENPGGRILGAFFHSVMTRSGGFNTHDISALGPDSLLVSTALMLIGGGSASTAGGIRITTFLLLGFVVWSEIRGHPDSIAFRRRLAPDIQRQATAIVLLAVGAVSAGILALAAFVEAPVEKIMFEAVSAFGTVGLSTGLSASMPPAGQLILVALMYIGRVGTVSLAAAFALRLRSMPYRYPEERPIVG